MDFPGIHRVKAKLADGSTRDYYYAWRGGPRLTGTPGSPEFVNSYTEAMKQRRTPSGGTLFTIIAEYRGSAEFKKLSEPSRKNYLRYLRLIEGEFGTMPIEALEDKAVRGDFKAWRDGFADKPRMADYAWTTLVRVLSFGVDRGRIAFNACARGGRLYQADRAEIIWTADHIARFMAAAPQHLRLALALAIWTGQRQGDLLRLQWSAYTGTQIRVRQSKTGKRVVIPAHATLQGILGQTKRRNLPILTNLDGDRWTSDGFRTSWRKACQTAGIDDVTFHDLRGTAVTRLALSGCTVPEIAAITGHSIADAEAILEKHYLGGSIELAEAAMLKLETAGNRFTIGS